MSRSQIAGAAVLVGVLSTVGIAQQTMQSAQQHEHQQTAPTPSSAGSGMMMDQNRDKMMADMKASDARLQELVSKMNAATGDRKVTVMADLLAQLVKEQVAMHQHMMQMGDRMTSQTPKK